MRLQVDASFPSVSGALVVLGLFVAGRGVLLAARRARGASTWMGTSAALALVVTAQIPVSRWPLPAAGVIAVGCLLSVAGFGLATGLKREREQRLDEDDNVQIERFARDGRAHRLALRMRGRPRRRPGRQACRARPHPCFRP